MKERAYNKENNYGDYQIRPKQYSNYNLQKELNNYPSPAFDNQPSSSKPIDIYDQPRRRDYSDHYDANKYEDKYEKKTYARNDRSQLADKYDFCEKKAKQVPYQPQDKLNQDTFAEHSFGDMSLHNDSNFPQNKRQNAKRKGLQIKMSNINCINDKINSLLSMVKKDKIDCHSKDQQNSPKKSQSPVLDRISAQTFQMSENKSALKSGAKVSEPDYRQINKSGQRLRTYSAIQQKSSSKKPFREEYSKNNLKQFNNEEDKYTPEAYNPKNYYSPSKNQVKQQPSARPQIYENKTYEKLPSNGQTLRNERLPSKYSPINQRTRREDLQIQGNEVNMQKMSSKKGQKPVTTNKYERPDMNLKNSPAERTIAYERIERTPTRSNLNNIDGNFMPITLLQNQTTERPAFQRRENYSGIKMIDDKIKRIKQKINQSQNQNRKYQQRLVDAREQKSQITVGKIYTNDATSSNKKFEIKVHPVINDKAETVKIAQKLCYQIEIDGRMRRARQEFEEIEGEQKWTDLEAKLSKNGIRLTLIEVKQLITFSPDEFSPFQTEGSNQSLDLIKTFTEAQKFWEKEVNGCASMKNLRSEGFSINELDLNRKGYLNIEDFVCFVNLYTGHFYKNRDLAIIYRRLQLLQRGKDEQGIDFSTFLRAFTI